MTTFPSAASNAAFNCSTELKKYYDAYVALTTGQNMVRMRTADNREVQYGIGDLSTVKKMYIMLYNQCGASSGLPDISQLDGMSATQRGGPARIGC